MTDFAYRFPDNAPGKYYVHDQCLDCDLCRETAPAVLKRNDSDGYAYVAKQPETDEELALCEESAEGCPCEAIGKDGDQNDWSSPIQEGEHPEHPNRARVCKHCQQSKSFWTKLRTFFKGK